MKPPAASHSVDSASPSSSRPASSGLKTAGPRIAPKTEPNSTSAIPRARRSGGYMSPAAVRASSAVELAAPTMTRPPRMAGAQSLALPSAARQQPGEPDREARRQHRHAAEAVHEQPCGERGERARREHDRRPEPEQPSMSSTRTSVSDATAAASWSVAEFAASDADSSAVLRRMGRGARGGHRRCRGYPS